MKSVLFVWYNSMQGCFLFVLVMRFVLAVYHDAAQHLKIQGCSFSFFFHPTVKFVSASYSLQQSSTKPGLLPSFVLVMKVVSSACHHSAQPCQAWHFHLYSSCYGINVCVSAFGTEPPNRGLVFAYREIE